MTRSALTERLSQPRTAERSRLALSGKVAAGVLGLMVLVAITAPWIAHRNPLAIDIPVQPPSGAHWLGTDRTGRDIYARLVHGARNSLAIGFASTGLALAAGAVLGSLVATSRRFVSETVMRLLDIIMAFPAIALAAVIVTVFGKSLFVLIVTIAFVYTPQLTRIVRGNVMAQYGEDYVAAERVIGASRPHILSRHVAVNCAAPVLVFATVMVADAIVFEASLSFIGAGVQDPAPSWGNVISYGRTILLNGGWWATFFGGMAILVTVLALNILAERLADAWASPGARKTAAHDAAAVETTATAEHERISNQSLALLRAATVPRPRATNDAVDTEPMLSVRDLSVAFPASHGGVEVVQATSFDIAPGSTMGLVGESGCGKSLTSLAIMGLLPSTARVGGSIRFAGDELLTMARPARRALMGHQMAMVYQDALSSLNPCMRIGTQLGQLIRRGGTRSAAELLDMVGLSSERTLRAYPHELSGGQRQRVLIAMALSRSPKLLIADEPTTALDVTIQAQVVELLRELQRQEGFAMLLVSHDLGLVSDLADDVVVMYGGNVVEHAETTAVLRDPQHPYTRGLLSSVVSVEGSATRLFQIPGVVPSPADFGPGCRFAGRCSSVSLTCLAQRPTLTPGAHGVACFHPVIADSTGGPDSSGETAPEVARV